MGASGDGNQPGTKVGRLIREYDLGERYGADMEAAWTDESDERVSLRDLADRFNRDILAAALKAADVTALGRDADATYRLLTTDDVTTGTRTEARQRLERDGVDVDQLESDFVTYQAIRSYLQTERGAEYDREREGGVAKTAESIGRLRSRHERVTVSNLERLRDTERLTLGEFRLFVSADVLCEDCGSQYSVEALLERGGCDCSGEAD